MYHGFHASGRHDHGVFRRFAREDHGRHRHREHGGGRSSLARFFAHGDLRLVILHLISEKPRHGYEIIKAIEERVGGVYSPSPGVIYPTLTLLEELGYVTVSEPSGGKKLHTATAQGAAFLEANRPALEILLLKMDEAMRAQDDGAYPGVSRAMERLKHALRLRLARGPVTEAQADAVAACLDEAARKVEGV